MTEKMRNDPKVKEAEDFLKRWMSLTPMKKERAKGYLECLEGTEQYQQPQKTAQEERMLVLVCIGCSVVVSVITTKLLAIHYFGIVNGYVDEICNMTKDFVHKTESMICRHQQKNDQEE